MLKPFLSFKVKKHENKYDNHHAPKYEITVFVMQFWHIVKVHSVNTSNKCEWNKNSSYDGQLFHNFIHFIADNAHIHIHQTANHFTIQINTFVNIHNMI